MIVVGKDGIYREVDPKFTSMKETDKGLVVTYKVIKEYSDKLNLLNGST